MPDIRRRARALFLPERRFVKTDAEIVGKECGRLDTFITSHMSKIAIQSLLVCELFDALQIKLGVSSAAVL
jgi:hypothetical protein